MTTSTTHPSQDWREFDQEPLPPILQGALEAFSEHGFHGASVRDVANRAGVTVPLLYYHYGSKEGLYVALVDLSTRETAWRTAAADADGSTPTERLANVTEAIVRHVTQRHLFAAVAGEARHLSPANRDRFVEPRREIEQIVERILADGVTSGEFTDLDVDRTARALLGLWRSVMGWYSPAGPDGPAEIAAQYVELSLRMVRP
ncbi:TetR/AcrR family transcriptional regulator [Nocardioides insulae]|uniref:TetR/AcrR family transcriptional regulator n=1 Tax=Nocardioides insulae TaxID=394734 RepID=UPI00040FC3A3|nr:TetR/AcrR family transcriptional regulator [Nocardioides insulae]